MASVAAPDIDDRQHFFAGHVAPQILAQHAYLRLRSQIKPDQLPAKVKDLLTNKLDKTCYLKADARAKYEKVVEVVNSMRSGGVDQLGLLTEQEQAKGAEGAKPGEGAAPAKK